MSIPVPVLPADVMAALAPAIATVQEEARQATRAAMLPGMVRQAKVAVRTFGSGERSEHDRGAGAALTRAFPGLVDARYASEIRLTDNGAPSTVDSRSTTRRTCACAACEVTDCDGGCDPCDDYDCEQCHEQCNGGYACCGYCPDHQGHYGTEHGGDTDDVRYSPARSEPYCRECDHWCDRD